MHILISIIFFLSINELSFCYLCFSYSFAMLIVFYARKEILLENLQFYQIELAKTYGLE